MKYIAKVKSRDKASQTTGYKRITEWQFIIIVFDNCKNIKVEIIGRWFPTAEIAKSEAKVYAEFLNIELGKILVDNWKGKL